jgi:glycoside/pentoside/hexuronide:cation symporter, GPH family
MAQPAFEPKEPLTPKTEARPFGWRDKLGYLFGDFGNDFFFILVAIFLMVFYTDVFHINPATVGVLFMVARLWDAFADVAWGRFIDTRKTTPNGKFKPWIFRMSFPLVITGVLMFVKIPGMSDGFYLAWAFVTYIVWGTLYSTVNIPYGSMASVITDDPVERTSLSGWRTMGAQAAGLIIGVIGPMIVFVDNKLDPNRMLMAAIVFGILAISCYMACYKLTTERITAPERPKQEGKKNGTIKGLVKNKPLIWILVASLTFMVCTMLIQTINTYLFKDYFGNTGALSMINFVTSGTVFVLMPFLSPLVKKFGKKELAAFGMLLAGVVYLALFFLKDISAIQFVSIITIGMFGNAIFNLVIWAFVTDVIDYHEFLTGLREDATVYSIYSMARKIGQAVAGGLGGALIGMVGYNAAVGQQTQETLNGIHTLGTLLPAVIFLLIFLIIVFFYPLNKQRTLQLATDLAEKRNSQQ